MALHGAHTKIPDRGFAWADSLGWSYLHFQTVVSILVRRANITHKFLCSFSWWWPGNRP